MAETDCTYYFNWETAFACVKEKEDLLCRVRDGNKHYDLSALTRYPGEFNSSESAANTSAGNVKITPHPREINKDLQISKMCLLLPI